MTVQKNLDFPWSMEDTIENLKELKEILQEQLRRKNYEGQGERDVKEIALDFDRAIQALEEVEQYRALGTVEELKEARKKQVAKKPHKYIAYDGIESMDEYIRGVLSYARQFEYAQQKKTSEFFYDLVDYLKRLQAQPKTDWIPCEERLPSENGKYLVSTDGTFGIDVIDIARFENGEFHKSCKIIAWQPLPQPYKKEGAE